MTTGQAHNAQAMTDDGLVAELARRGITPQCRCGRTTYIDNRRTQGNALRCAGCLKAIGKCTC